MTKSRKLSNIETLFLIKDNSGYSELLRLYIVNLFWQCSINCIYIDYIYLVSKLTQTAVRIFIDSSWEGVHYNRSRIYCFFTF